MFWKQSVKMSIYRRCGLVGFLAAAILVFSSTVTKAAAYYWHVPSGDWSNADNWGGTKPTSSDEADIYKGYTATITQTGAQCYLLLLGDPDSSGTVEMTGGSLTVAADAQIGCFGTGTFTQTGGTNSTHNLWLGTQDSSANGTYNLSDTGQLSTNNETIGATGTGTFTQTGGTNSITSSLSVGGSGSGSSGTYKLSGNGQLSALSEVIGGYGTGTFTQTGGTNTIAALLVAAQPNSSGTYKLSGAGQLSADYESIGSYGTGTFTQTGGTNTVNNYLFLGDNPGSNGTYNLSGGTLSTPVMYLGYSGIGRFEWFCNGFTTPWLYLGPSPTLAMGFNFDMATLISGTLFNGTALSITGLAAMHLEITNNATATQSGNTSVSIGHLKLGTTAGSGTYDLSGAGQLSATSELIGDNSTGTFTQTGGTNTISTLTLGFGPSSNATYNLSGTGQLTANYESIGQNWGLGTFTQTGGTNTISSELWIGMDPDSNATYNLSGTGQLTAKSETIGFMGPGTFTQTGGTNSITDSLYLSLLPGFNGTYKLNGGTLILLSLDGGQTAAFNFGGGTLQASGNFTTSLPMTLTGDGGNANIDTASYAVGLGGVLSGTAGLNKLGSGTLTISNTATYAGNTTVGDGTLIFSGGIASSGTSLIDVQSGTAALKTVTVNKTNLNINTAALATFEIVNGSHTVGAITGSGNTQLDANASLTAASISQNTLTLAPGATLTIAALPGGPLGNPITPVPEPSAFVFLSIAFFAAGSLWIKKTIRS